MEPPQPRLFYFPFCSGLCSECRLCVVWPFLSRSGGGFCLCKGPDPLRSGPYCSETPRCICDTGFLHKLRASLSGVRDLHHAVPWPPLLATAFLEKPASLLEKP